MVINHLLNGMILQVGTHFVHKKSPSDVNPRTFAHQTTEVRETSGTLGYADPLYIRSGFKKMGGFWLGVGNTTVDSGRILAITTWDMYIKPCKKKGYLRYQLVQDFNMVLLIRRTAWDV